MHERYKTEALVLSRRNIGEADRLVTFFTPDRGVFKAIAKGVRKMPSARGGHLEPYTKVLALLTASRAGTYVGGVETIDYYDGLKQQPAALVHARNIAFILTRLFEEDDPQEDLYDAVTNAWESLPALPPAKRRVLEGALLLYCLRLAGILPSLGSCMRCSVQKPSEAVLFDAKEAGWHCITCHRSLKGAGHSLPSRLLPVIRFMAATPNKSLQVVISDDESKHIIKTVRRFTLALIEQPVQSQSQTALAYE